MKINRTTILTGITAGQAAEGDWVEPLGVRSALHDEPAPGVIRQMQLGASGVTMLCGGEMVAIPAAELWALAEKANPNFVPRKINALAKQ